MPRQWRHVETQALEPRSQCRQIAPDHTNMVKRDGGRSSGVFRSPAAAIPTARPRAASYHAATSGCARTASQYARVAALSSGFQVRKRVRRARTSHRWVSVAPNKYGPPAPYAGAASPQRFDPCDVGQRCRSASTEEITAQFIHIAMRRPWKPELSAATRAYCDAVRAHPLVAAWYEAAAVEPSEWLLPDYETPDERRRRA